MASDPEAQCRWCERPTGSASTNLRTHRELRSVVVEGEDTECPEWTSSPPPDRMLSELSATQWQTVLADLVNAELA
ncbi:hypothetical protein GCM10028864_18120 [Microlunatus parietis]